MPKETFMNLPPDKQEKVMRSAINEFIKNGFDRGNIGDIAKNAGVAKGSMYQYFENKRELFLFAVRWALDVMMKKYVPKLTPQNEETDIFDFLMENTRDSMIQIREERELGIFLQNVFLGKYHNLTDESMEYMMKFSEDYMINLIEMGQRNGSVRKDIDKNIIYLYTIGVSYKLKEYMMNKARDLGEDILDADYELYEKDIKDMIELLKHGMGGR